MVYSAFFCDENQLEILDNLGCAGDYLVNKSINILIYIFLLLIDSKQLTEERRSSIFSEYEKHKNNLGFILKVLSPHMISTCMLRRYVILQKFSFFLFLL
jgi:hypothetical protein